MALETTLFSIFGGNKAADEIKDAQRKTIKFTKQQQARQEGVNAPYLAGGTEGFNALRDFALTTPGEPDEFTRGLEDQVSRSVLGRYSQMGLTDSGAGRNALYDAIIRNRLGVRGHRMNELGTLAGFGERGANRFTGIGQFATGVYGQAQNALGQAGAFPWLNASNALNRWEDQILNAAGTVAGGGGGGGGGIA